MFSSNIGVYGSNLAISTSNFAYPNLGVTSNQSIFGSNTSVFSSNIGVYGSNLSIVTSNFAYTNLGVTSNQAIFGSNMSVASSNVLYSNIPWKSLGSNVYLQTSNVGINVTVPAYPFHVNGKIYGTSQYLASNDTAAIPSFTWITTSNTGIFSPATNIVGVSTNGIERFRIDTSNIVIGNDVMVQGQMYGSNDTSNLPTYSWSNNSNTGMYQPATNIVGIATNGIERMRIDTSNVVIANDVMLQNQIFGSNDTSNIPTYSWSNDSNTGMFQPDANIVGFTTNGVERMRIDTSNIVITNDLVLQSQIHASNDTSNWPSYAWSNDSNTGMYQPAANQIAFSLNGASAIQFVDSNAQFSSNVTVNSNLIVRGVNYVYGRENYYASNLAPITLATNVLTTRTAISNMLEGGRYQISVSTLNATATASRYTISRIALSNINGAAQVLYTVSNACAVANREACVSYYMQTILPTGSNIITLQYAGDNGSTMTIRQSSITCLRIG